MKIRTDIKAGALTSNHNEKIMKNRSKGLIVKTGVKAGGMGLQHNQTMVRG